MMQYTCVPFESENCGCRARITPGANEKSPAGFFGSSFGSVRFALALALAIAIAALAPLRSNPT